jgi:hypothetical protein
MVHRTLCIPIYLSLIKLLRYRRHWNLSTPVDPFKVRFIGMGILSGLREPYCRETTITIRFYGLRFGSLMIKRRLIAPTAKKRRSIIAKDRLGPLSPQK